MSASLCFQNRASGSPPVGGGFFNQHYGDFCISRDKMRFGNYEPGRFAWVLQYVRPLEDVGPVRGFQRLWNWPGIAKPSVQPALAGLQMMSEALNVPAF